MRKLTQFLFVLIITNGLSCNEDNPEILVATSIEIVSGNEQNAEIETELQNPIILSVKDQNGESFADAIVTFSLTEGDISIAIDTTDENGLVSTIWTLGSSIGVQTLIVTIYRKDVNSNEVNSPLFVNATALAPKIKADIEGNIYKVISIGDQLWFAENLKTTKYNDGTAISLITNNAIWSNSTTGAYCWFVNDESIYKDTFGALYNWYTVENKNICPMGWHVPTLTEWEQLISYYGGHTQSIDSLQSGSFSAIASGNRGCNGNYGLFNAGFWWSSDELPYGGASAIYTGDIEGESLNTSGCKNAGFSIRCIKD